MSLLDQILGTGSGSSSTCPSRSLRTTRGAGGGGGGGAPAAWARSGGGGQEIPNGQKGKEDGDLPSGSLVCRSNSSESNRSVGRGRDATTGNSACQPPASSSSSLPLSAGTAGRDDVCRSRGELEKSVREVEEEACEDETKKKQTKKATQGDVAGGVSATSATKTTSSVIDPSNSSGLTIPHHSTNGGVSRAGGGIEGGVVGLEKLKSRCFPSSSVSSARPDGLSCCFSFASDHSSSSSTKSSSTSRDHPSTVTTEGEWHFEQVLDHRSNLARIAERFFGMSAVEDAFRRLGWRWFRPLSAPRSRVHLTKKEQEKHSELSGWPSSCKQKARSFSTSPSETTTATGSTITEVSSTDASPTGGGTALVLPSSGHTPDTQRTNGEEATEGGEGEQHEKKKRKFAEDSHLTSFLSIRREDGLGRLESSRDSGLRLGLCVGSARVASSSCRREHGSEVESVWDQSREDKTKEGGAGDDSTHDAERRGGRGGGGDSRDVRLRGTDGARDNSGELSVKERERQEEPFQAGFLGHLREPSKYTCLMCALFLSVSWQEETYTRLRASYPRRLRFCSS